MEDEIRSEKHDKSISNILINIIASFSNSYSITNDSLHSTYCFQYDENEVYN